MFRYGDGERERKRHFTRALDSPRAQKGNVRSLKLPSRAVQWAAGNLDGPSRLISITAMQAESDMSPAIPRVGWFKGHI